MSKIVWGKEMTDKEFVKASEEYFGKRFWDLHVGCCLIAKIDPEEKSKSVGLDYLEWTENDDDENYDYTKRPFLIALRAISAAENSFPDLYKTVPLPVDVKPDKIQSGKDIVVDTRIFIKWVIEQWPDSCAHFVMAENEYELRKMNKKKQDELLMGKKKIDKWSLKSKGQKEEFRLAFWEMVKKNNLELNSSKGKVSKWTKDLIEIMSITIANPYEFKTVYPWVGDWIEEYQEYKETSKK